MKTVPSIKDIGLKNHLENTKDKHHGLGYTDFVEMLNSDLDYTGIQIAKAFGISKETLYKWLRIHEEEQK